MAQKSDEVRKRQIHLSPNVVQVVPVAQVVIQLSSPKTDSSVSQRLFKLFPFVQVVFQLSPNDKVVQVVPVVQVVFLIFPTDRFICLKVVL